MAKAKNPLLSLGARGTLADSITYTRRRGIDILEKKPVPAYRRTLPQQYQRWLYEDYAYQWRQQTPATQQAYRTLGSRHHLTGFQYWMKYQLTYLPDIVAWWKLDEPAGAVARDSSRHRRDGTITGATSVVGTIDQALSFDGVNDMVTFPVDFILEKDILEHSFLLWYTPGRTRATGQFISSIEARLELVQEGTTHLIEYWIYDTAFRKLRSDNAVVAGTKYFIVATYDGTNMRLYIDGQLQTNIVAANPPTIDVGHYFSRLATRFDAGAAYFNKCVIDNYMIFNRPLSQTEIDRWAERRYP